MSFCNFPYRSPLESWPLALNVILYALGVLLIIKLFALGVENQFRRRYL
jgi:hypothetical protein